MSTFVIYLFLLKPQLELLSVAVELLLSIPHQLTKR